VLEHHERGGSGEREDAQERADGHAAHFGTSTS
jgi:hypothetical protein